MTLDTTEIWDLWNGVFQVLGVVDEARKTEARSRCEEVIKGFLDAIEREKSAPTMAAIRKEIEEIARLTR